MNKEKIYENLCVKDCRSPYFVEDEYDNIEPRSKDCYCDNCFYGRDKLAMEILRLKGIVDE